MIIVLDSNIIIADFHFRGTGFETLRQVARQLGVRIAIPAPVPMEVIRNYRKRLQGSLQAAEKALKQLDDLTAGRISSGAVLSTSIEDLVKSYELELQRHFETLGAQTLPYPAVDHEVVVHRLVSRRKPFKESGEGYVDALIWETVLQIVLRSPSEEVVLISNNRRDFADSSGTGVVVELLDEVADKQLSSDRVRFAESLNRFIELLLQPRLVRADELLLSLNQGQHEFVALIHDAFPTRVIGLKDKLLAEAKRHFRAALNFEWFVYPGGTFLAANYVAVQRLNRCVTL